MCICEENYQLSSHNSITIYHAFEGDQGGTGKYFTIFIMIYYQIEMTKNELGLNF